LATERYEILVRLAGAKGATDQLNRLERQGRRTADAMAFFRKALVLFSTVRAASGLVNLIDTAARVDNRLRIVTRSTTEFADAQAFLSRISKDTFTGLDANAQGYARIVQAATAAGISQDKAKEAFEAVAQAARIGGNTTAEYESSLIQLSQGLASGAVQGQELRSIAEQLPIVAQAIGEEFGVAGGKLIAFAKANEGILESERVVKALSDALPELTARASRIAPTISGAFENVRTSFIELVREVNNGSGIINTFTQGILFLADNLKTLTQATIVFLTAFTVAKLAAPLGVFIQATTNVLALTRVLGLATTAQLLFNRAALANPYTALAAVLLAAGAALVYLYTQFETVRTVINATLIPLQVLGGLISSIITSGFNAVAEVIERLNVVWQAFVAAMDPLITALQAIGQALYPIIEPFVTWFNLLTENSALVQIFTGVLVALITTGLAPLVLGLQGGVEVMYLFGAATAETRDTMRDATVQFFSLATGTVEVADGAEKSAQGMDAASRSARGLESNVGAANGEVRVAGANIQTLGNTSSEAAAKIDQVSAAADNSKGSVKELGDESSLSSEKIGQLINAIERLTESIGDVETASRQTQITLQQTATGASSTSASFNLAAGSTADFGNSLAFASSAAASADGRFRSTANSLSSVTGAARNAAVAVRQVSDAYNSIRVADFGDFGENSGFGPSSGFAPSGNFGSSGLAGTTGTVGGGSGRIGSTLDQVNLTRSQLEEANNAARSLAESNARLTLGYELLEQTVSQRLSDGLISAAEASSAFTTGKSLIEKSLNDPSVLTKLQAAGETMYSGIVDQVLNSAVDASRFLTSRIVEAQTDPSFGVAPRTVSASGGSTSRTNSSRIGSVLEELSVKDVDLDPNPFDIMSQFADGVSTASSSVNLINNTASYTAGALDLVSGAANGLVNSFQSGTNYLEQVYNKLDLARQNVSPLNNQGQNVISLNNLPGFNRGGSLTVGGSGSPDSRLFMAKVSPGERVDVLTRQQQRMLDGFSGRGGGVTLNVNLNSADAVREYRNSQASVDRRIASSVRRVNRYGRDA
jgi:tape measure domain-containing protein